MVVALGDTLTWNTLQVKNGMRAKIVLLSKSYKLQLKRHISFL